MTKDITTTQESLPVAQADQTFALLQQAVQAGTSPESLEKLVALQERILDRNAKAEFTTAMALFQSRCPAVEKKHAVKDRGGRIMYHYAPLEDIVEQIRDLMAELGLSFSFSSDSTDRGIDVTCTIRHAAGHSETSHAFIPSTKGMNTNAAQDAVLQLTYGKRQTLINALGITTADQDTDGVTQTVRPITKEQALDIRALILEVEANMSKFLAYLNVDMVEDIPAKDFDRAVAALEAKRAKK